MSKEKKQKTFKNNFSIWSDEQLNALEKLKKDLPYVKNDKKFTKKKISPKIEIKNNKIDRT